ncbi:2-oxoglutarate dehydrogenase E1 [Brevibacillus brevis]|uniref:ASCH domain-containing protein n=1 Tax=Brevibacillus brevis TaxID=1393 RepID=UPI0019026330|nr:ASCH domain-containing protein [Brevibacillus brevis]MBH0331049.1 2-oxoglutarate dehydrogenase E1 [Brevibacillus brevis]
MKAITIHQPWATLIALGEKRFESRGWPTRYRGPIAIHAAKKVDKELCLQEPFRSVLDLHGYTVNNLPVGAIVAIADLVGCHKVIGNNGTESAFLNNSKVVDGHELLFGHFDFGRYAWEMADVKQIDPVPAKGQQGLWNWGEERDASRTCVGCESSGGVGLRSR